MSPKTSTSRSRGAAGNGLLTLANPEHFELREPGLYVQKAWGPTGAPAGILEDGNAGIFMPETFRLFNSYESAQLLRHWVALHWLREVHEGPTPLTTVVDLGCSYSKLYSMWYENGNFFGRPPICYIGVDGHERRLMNGRSTVLGRHRSTDTIVHVHADIAMRLDFVRMAEAVVSMETFEHIQPEGIHALLDTAYRTLVPGGAFIASGENPDRAAGEWGVYKDSQENHFQEWPFEEFVALAEGHGFELARKCFLHAKRSYSRASGLPGQVFKGLRGHLPSSMVNALCAMLDEERPYNAKQWMLMFTKPRSV